MEKSGFKVVDGRLIKLGPQVIEVEPADMQEWQRLIKEFERIDERWLLLVPIIGMALIIPTVGIACIVGFTLASSLRQIYIILGVATVVMLIGLNRATSFSRSRLKQCKNNLRIRQQTILAKYGDYKLDEVVGDDRSLHNLGFWTGRNPAKYVLIEKGSVS